MQSFNSIASFPKDRFIINAAAQNVKPLLFV